MPPNTFSSDVLLKKVGSLQEQNDSLSSDSRRLADSLEHSKQKNRRLVGLVEQTYVANRKLVFVSAGLVALSLVLGAAALAMGVHAGSFVLRERKLAGRVSALQADLTAAEGRARLIEAKLEDDKEKLSAEVEALRKANESLGFELKKAQVSFESIREEKIYLEDILIHKSRQLENLKSDVATAQSEEALKKSQEEIGRLSEENRILSTKLEKLYKTTSERLQAIGVAKTTLEQTLVDAQKRVEEEMNLVELGSIRAAKSAGSGKGEAKKGAARKDGRVRAVNEAHGFVVIDLGKVDGVRQDTVFHIKKAGEWLATLTVIEIRDVMTACNVKNAVPGYKIRVDDPVLTLQK